MIRILLLLLPLLLIAIPSRLAAQENADPIPGLAGDWIVPGAVTTITIKPDHTVQHSRWGSGDIVHENANYYKIHYRERTLTCSYKVRTPSATELSMLNYENLDLPGCELGELRRAPYYEGAPGEVSQIWAQIKDTEDPKILEAFRRQFGAKNPAYDSRAKKRLAELRPASADGAGGNDGASEDLGAIIGRWDNLGRSLSITSDAPVYRRGGTANFTVVSSQGCYLTLVSQGEKEHDATVIFPNRFQQNNRIEANTPVILPGPNARFDFRVKDPGTETVIAVCSDSNVPVDGIIHDFNRSAFTSVPNYANAVSRGIEVQMKSAGRYGPQNNFQPSPAAVWRAALKVQVR